MSLYDQLSGGVNNFSPNGNPQIGGAGMGLVPQSGNPVFSSQIDIAVQTVASRVNIDHSATNAGTSPIIAVEGAVGTTPPMFGAFQDPQATTVVTNHSVSVIGIANVDPAKFGSSLPTIIFGNSDLASGYARANSLNPESVCQFAGAYNIDRKGYTYSISNYMLGLDSNAGPTTEFVSNAVRTGVANAGDLILLYVYKTSSTQELSSIDVCEVVISCPQVAYTTLIDAISSDTFVIDGIRYTVPDVTKIDQFTNAIQTVRQSLFGKLQSDSMNPNSMNMPFNNQSNIIDVPLQLGVDKNLIVNTRINTTCRKFIWSLFIKTTQKIKA